jgi:putative ABC transport system permease protein
MVVPIAEKACNYTVNGVNYTAEVTGVDFAQYNALYNQTFVSNASAGSFIPVADPSNTSLVIGASVAANFKIGQSLTLQIWNSTNELTPPFSPINILLNSYTGSVGAILPAVGGFNLGGPADSGIYMQMDNALAFFNSSTVSSIIVQLGVANPTQDQITNVTDTIETYFNNLVTVTSGTAILSTINSIFSIITVFIGAIAGISLVVAGIGIMNIQIVAILERTREIGILKAMGAKDRTILGAFLSETLFIGLIGAGLGILVGYALALVAGSVIGGLVSGGGGFGGIGGGAAARTAASSGITIMPVITISLLLEAVLFGVLVAVVFGLYPAWRASRLKPVEALRAE